MEFTELRHLPQLSRYVLVLHIYLMKLHQGRFILLVYGLPVISSFHPVMTVD